MAGDVERDSADSWSSGLVRQPSKTDFDYFLRAMRAVAPSLALEPVPIDVETGTDIEREIELFARKPGRGLVLPPDATTISHSDLVIALANRHRLPAVYPFASLWPLVA